MNKLSDFKDDINRCSKCGLCQSVCPIYKITGNDCAVSRGKFVMLDGVLKGNLKLNQTINKYLDMCLNCGKCKNFCPSGIDVCKIFNTAKYEYTKNTFEGKFIFFLLSKLVFGNVLKLLKVFANPFRAKVKKINKKPDLKLIYFKGCINNIFPKCENSLKKIFSHFTNVEFIEKNFDCCGLPFLAVGNLKRYEEIKNHNLELLNCDFDYILTDCASCESTLQSYSTDFKFISAAQFVAEQNIKFKFKKPLKITFHKPCHLENLDFLPKILEKCENIEYIEMKNYYECCGFAGSFAIKNPKLSALISKTKAENIIQTHADYVLTTCPACILGLKQGLLLNGKNSPRIMNIVDFLAMAEIISNKKSNE